MKDTHQPDQPWRLNRLLASAGYGSRRECEQLIIDGRVEIDGSIVTDLSTKVDLEKSDVRVDSVLLKRSRPIYFALNKPSGVLCTNHDPSGRTLVVDLIPTRERIFSVGRLDRASEGLILLTNDGKLAQRLAHPRFGVQKTYFATVQGEITQEEINKLRKGVHLAEGFARVDGVKIRKVRKSSSDLEILLSEGKNREIRRVLARFGHKVVVLRRLAIGSLRLGTLPVGASRPLAKEEVAALYAATSIKRKPRSSNRPKSPEVPGDTGDERAQALNVSGDFISLESKSTGSVIAFDDDEMAPAKPNRQQRPSRNLNKSSDPKRRAAVKSGRAKSATSTGTATSSRTQKKKAISRNQNAIDSGKSKRGPKSISRRTSGKSGPRSKKR